jgi:hypothetical protein
VAIGQSVHAERGLLGLLRDPRADGDVAAQRGMLEQLLAASTGEALLRAIVADRDWLDSIAQRSYRHVNGFDKLILAGEGPRGRMVKLDVWWPDVAAEEEQAHNHQYDFASHVMIGSLRHRLFEPTHVDDLDPPVEAALYSRVEAAEDRSGTRARTVVRPVADVWRRATLDCIMPAGTTYSIHRQQFHAVGNAAEATATIVVQSCALRGHSEVLTARAVDTSPRSPQRLDRSAIADNLERLADVIAAPSSGS